jgi:hypothetical protein
MSDWPCPKCTLRPDQTCSDQDCPGMQKRRSKIQPLPHPALLGISGVMGCICPPTSEQTCMNPLCPRKPIGKAQ